MGKVNTGPEAVKSALAAAHSSVIFLHLNADGDSVGSSLALAHGLRRRGAQVEVVYADRNPAAFTFLPGADQIRDWQQLRDRKFDVAILPDCSDRERIGAAVTLLDGIPRLVNVDHHASNQGFGDVYWVDPQRSCTGEMVLELLDLLQVSIDAAIATCLYTAIATDTGAFRFQNTSPRAHRYAARMLECGAKPAQVSEELFDKRSLPAIRLLTDVLETMLVAADGSVAWIKVTQEMLRRHGAGPDDIDGLIAYPRSLIGVMIALAFYEQEDGSVRVSLRSRGDIDVAVLAAEFSGGGHARAAGCSHPGPLGVAEREVVARAQAFAAGRSGS